jgi:hypothetical protein
MELKEKRNETLKSPTGPIQPRAENINHAPGLEEIRLRAYEIHLSVAASQAMSLMTGCKRNANSSMRRRQKRAISSRERDCMKRRAFIKDSAVSVLAVGTAPHAFASSVSWLFWE